MTQNERQGPRSILLCLVLLTPACSTGEPRWAGAVDTVAGVPVVRNPSQPLHPPGEVTLEPVWSQAGPATGSVWEDPRDVVAGESGVFILDRLARRVYRLDPATGAQEAAFGREGGGPGELSGPTGLAMLGGLPVVLDERGGTLERYSVNGEHIQAVRLNAIIFGIDALGGDSLLVTAFGGDALLNVVAGDSLRAVPEPAPVAGVEAGLESCSRFGHFDSLAVRLSCVRPYFQVFDTHGHLVREVLVDRGPEERAAEDLAAYLAMIRQTLSERGQPAAMIDQVVADQREAQRTRRPWQRVARAPGSGTIVVMEQEGEDFGSSAATLHLFDREGVYQAEVPAGEAWWDFTFVDGDIVALVRAADTGIVRAVRYRVMGLD